MIFSNSDLPHQVKRMFKVMARPKHNELQFTWNTKFQFWQKLMIYGLIRPYSSIRNRKNVLRNFFLMVENQKSDSIFFVLLSKSIENVSLFRPTSVPRCSAKICYSPYVVLQTQVNSFSSTSCAFLCQRFEIWLRKFLWITPITIAKFSTQLHGCGS